MIASATERIHAMTEATMAFLLTKPRCRLVGPTCTSDIPVDRGDGVAAPCRRPVWITVGVWGEDHALCSKCWHMRMAMFGPYTMLQANPAAAHLDDVGIQRLTFSDQELPELGSGRPDVFPAEWLA